MNFDSQDACAADQIHVVLFVCMVCEALTMTRIYTTYESKLKKNNEVSRFQFHMTSLGGKKKQLVASSKAWERR